MGNILLFGSNDVADIPYELKNSWLPQYIAGNHKFIVGDKKGADSSFHKELSASGVNKENVSIYAMDYARNNIFEFPVKKFITSYDGDTQVATIRTEDNSTEPYDICDIKKIQDIEVTREWYEYLDKKMIQDCDMGICVWTGDNKRVLHMIQLMNIYNKPVYTFTL